MEINILSTYHMIALIEEITPITTFFKDRYFPTAESDIFASDKVLTEYRKGDRKMAAFVAPGVGDISIDRGGYEINEYQPAYIAPSRILTLDDLKQRGFGEALFSNQTQAQRAARIVLQDLSDLEDRITRREEWMCVQTMINNACEMQEYVDSKTKGDILRVRFYDKESEHVYIVSKPWNSDDGDFFGDVKAMCRMLSKRGLRAVDLVLGSQVADVISNIPKVQKLLDNRNMEYGSLSPELTSHPGVAFMGTLNFGGFKLNLLEVTHGYVDDSGVEKPYFPATAAMVTAPDCGRLMYGQISQIDHGQSDFATYAQRRVPKLAVDQNKDTRKLRLGTRPLAAPKDYCPWTFAADVVE
ncbi:MAG: major capsid protein [Oscillospiraceae bacterium]|nr:major capsid protein [Oscillospiraceae bacterium]